jgi:ribosomal protein S18 acetylase RimI-like enzyme
MIAIRDYFQTDAEQVGQIVQTATRELRAIYVPKPVDKAELREQSIPAKRIVAVDIDSTVVGVAEFFVRSSEVYAQGIAVAATHRQRGIATALLDHIVELAIGLAIPKVQVSTIKETGNVEIFKRMGFAVIEERISARFIGLDEQQVTEVSLQKSAG